jgi:hypothetical protein
MFTLLADGKTCAANCGANKVLNTTTGQCSCISGYTPLANGTCVLNCGANATINPTTGECVCARYYTRLNDGRTCASTSCGQGGNLNLDTGLCSCVNGYSLLNSGICYRDCGKNAIFNKVNGSCSCPVGYNMLPDGMACENLMQDYFSKLSPLLTNFDYIYYSPNFKINNNPADLSVNKLKLYDSGLGFVSTRTNTSISLTNIPTRNTDMTFGLKFGMIPNEANPVSSSYFVSFTQGNIKFSPYIDALYPGKYGINVLINTFAGPFVAQYAPGKWNLAEYALIEAKFSLSFLADSKRQIQMTLNGVNSAGAIGAYSYTLNAGSTLLFNSFVFTNSIIQTEGNCVVFATSNPAILSQNIANSPGFFTCKGCDPTTTTCRFGECYPKSCVIGNDGRPECGGVSNCPAGYVVQNANGIYSCVLPHQCGGAGRVCPINQVCELIDGIRKCTIGGIPQDPTGSAGMLQLTNPVNLLELAGYPPHKKFGLK